MILIDLPLHQSLARHWQAKPWLGVESTSLDFLMDKKNWHKLKLFPFNSPCQVRGPYDK